MFRWGEEEYWRRLEEEERMWDEQAGHHHGMEWGHRMGPPPRPDFFPPDMVLSNNCAAACREKLVYTVVDTWVGVKAGLSYSKKRTRDKSRAQFVLRALLHEHFASARNPYCAYFVTTANVLQLCLFN